MTIQMKTTVTMGIVSLCDIKMHDSKVSFMVYH